MREIVENISYITDNDGNKTHTVIPWTVWENMKEILIDSKIKYGTENDANMTEEYQPFYLIQHYSDINFLLGKLNQYSNNNWKSLYENYFKYYDVLSQYDIQLLYFFRKGILLNPKNPKNLKEHLEFLFNNYGFTTLNDEKVDIENFEKLHVNSYMLNEISFLQYFNLNFKVREYDYKNVRLKRKSERDRLFIFDCIQFCELSDYLADIMKEIKHMDVVIEKRRNQIVNQLANYFYNGNKSQVYRAKQEAISKIELF